MRELNNEQEQVEFLKELWETYGRVMILGLLAGLAMMYGWRYYQSSQSQYAQHASTLYEQVLMSYEKQDTESMNTQASLLKSDFKKTPYAMLAALMQARAHVDAQEYDQAKELLQWVIEQARDEATAMVARIRLARVYSQLQQPGAGLALLEDSAYPAFAVYQNEIKGDLYQQQGNIDKAKDAYNAAIAASEDSSISRIIEMKLANLI